jgi:hypothetical protein
MRGLLTLFLLPVLQSCAQPLLLEVVMASNTPAIKAVTAKLRQHEVQIKFTEVNRTDAGSGNFNDQEFRADDTAYFYHARTVKFPIALLALEKLTEDSRISRKVPFTVQGELESSSFEREIIERFLVSDNQAYNRLFEHLGKDGIHHRGIMQRLIFPELFAENQRFHLAATDREFVLGIKQTLPYEAGFDRNEYYDSYVRFFLFGDSREPLPGHIKIYNKIGFAYGTLTHCAYIKNTLTSKEYIITATVLVNENQTFNDDNCEYNEIGLPFLAELGRQLLRVSN